MRAWWAGRSRSSPPRRYSWVPWYSEGQAAVVGCACEGTQAEGLRFQFRHFRESVAVVVVAVAMPVLAIYGEAYLVVHAHHGCVERRVVVQSAAYAY